MKILVSPNLKDKEKERLCSHFPNEDFTFIHYDNVVQEDVDATDILIGNLHGNINVNRENIQFMQLNSAGSDHYIQKGIVHPNTKLTNASGIYGKAIAEHTIGMILALNKNIPYYVNNMKEGIWKDFRGGKELYHSTIAIIGLGDLGYALAKRLKAFETHIIGVKRTASPLPKYIDEIYTIDALDTVLPKADFVILCLPQTKETIHLINKDKLALMKSDAMLINVGRGSAICTKDLIDALQSNQLYGAALDVTEQEPLPSEHPLWKMNNVLITPHSSGGFVWDSVRELFIDLTIRNLKHFFNNEELENTVDFTTGYRKHNTTLKNQ
ncbi:MAG: D-2-hydroxyacid dehydrogenase [Coprobacillaceae bacterium]